MRSDDSARAGAIAIGLGSSSPHAASRRRLSALAAGLLVGLGAPLGLLATPNPATATSVGSLRQRAQALAVEIDTMNTKLAILSEEYDEAEGHAVTLQHELGADLAALQRARATVGHDHVALQTQAVVAYVDGGSPAAASVLPSGSADALPLAQTYLQVAAGNLTTSIATLRDSERALAVRQNTLDAARTAAEENAATIGAARAAAASVEDALSATLSSVNGQLEAEVEAQEAAEQAAAERAAAAEAAQASAATAGDAAPPATSAPGAGIAAGGSASAAIAAVESQIGVPYAWGGATPGAGFDCSGLAMWAWSRAGVSLPHSAEAQWEGTEHVSLDALQPGDLVFYAAGGYVYHVVMYIGNGQVVQAEQTGIPVRITPLPGGAIGAGRP